MKETPHDSGLIEDTAATGDFTISATPTTLEAPILGTATVTVSIVRTGEVGAVTLTASGSPTITGTPATIAADATSTDVTLTLAAGTAAGPATLTISGSDGTHMHDVTVTITAKPIATVTGKVRGDRPNVFVGIVGQTPTATGADGSFTFTNITPPYDLYTYIPASTTSFESKPAQVYYYRGLTTATPFVSAGIPASSGLTPVLGFARSATVSGGLLGNGATVVRKLLAWSSGGSASNPAATYAVSATWRGFTPTGGLSINGTMYGLSWTTRTNGAPDQVYFGSTAATLSNGGSTGGIDVSLGAITSAQLTGTFTAPSGFPTPSAILSTLLPGGISYDLWSGTSTDGALSVPAIADAKFHLKVSSDSAGAKTTALLPDLSAVTSTTTTLPTPAVLVTPTANATGVSTTTPLHFTAPATGQVYVVTADSAAASYKVFTTDDTVTLPDVAELPLPAATSFTWLVEGYAPATSVDDAALEDAPEGISDSDFDGAAHAYTTSATRAFTSQ